MPEPDRFTRDDLVEATVAARRWRDAAPELRDWHAARHGALLAAFGEVAVAPEDAAPAWLDGAELGPDTGGDAEELAGAVLETLDALGSPFDGFLEAPPLFHAFFARHAAPIDRCTTEYRDVLHELLDELLGLQHGIPDSASVTADDLRRHGFDPDAPAPDPDDFW